MEQLVVARRLLRVLGGDDAHVAGEVRRAEESLGEVDDIVVQDERVEALAVERELRPGGVPRVPLARLRATHFGQLGRGREVAVYRILCGRQLVGRDGTGDDAPAVGVPPRLELRIEREG